MPRKDSPGIISNPYPLLLNWGTNLELDNGTEASTHMHTSIHRTDYYPYLTNEVSRASFVNLPICYLPS